MNCKSGVGAQPRDEIITDPFQYFADRPLSSAADETLNKYSMIVYKAKYTLRWEQYILEYSSSTLRQIFTFPNEFLSITISKFKVLESQRLVESVPRNYITRWA